jgi:hypothetical protein
MFKHAHENYLVDQKNLKRLELKALEVSKMRQMIPHLRYIKNLFSLTLGYFILYDSSATRFGLVEVLGVFFQVN